MFNLKLISQVEVLDNVTSPYLFVLSDFIRLSDQKACLLEILEISTLCIEVEEPRDLRSIVDPEEGPIDCTVNPTLTFGKGE